MIRIIFLSVLLLLPNTLIAQQGPMGRSLTGEDFVDFQFENLSGKKIDSDVFRKGKLLVMKMGNLSCPLCTTLLGKLGKLEKQFRNKNVVFLDVSFDEDREALKKHAKELGSEIETLIDPQGLLPSYYEIQGIPVTLIASADEKSTILFHYVGDLAQAKLKETIEKYLAK